MTSETLDSNNNGTVDETTTYAYDLQGLAIILECSSPIQIDTAETENMKYLYLILLAFLLGCGTQGPPSIHTDSSKISTMDEKIELLEQYVSFRRSYKQLDFRLDYYGGSLPPGPSDWRV